jgi:filamin
MFLSIILGMHQIEVTYENIPVPGSPFRINAIPGCDPMRVRAYGLENAITNEPTTFTIETKGAGQGSLGLAIEGPSEAKMICKNNQDGTCVMEYLPVEQMTMICSLITLDIILNIIF